MNPDLLPNQYVPETAPRGRSLLFKVIVLGVALALAVVVVIHFTGSAGQPMPRAAMVSINEQGFTPSTLTIHMGSTVHWDLNFRPAPASDDSDVISTDNGTHGVVSGPFPTNSNLPSLNSHQLGTGAQYEFTFTRPGSFPYYDPAQPSHQGVVTVIQ